MAEQLKEIVNQTFTQADLTNTTDLVLFTNAASTQFVVKDIQIEDNPDELTGKLMNNEFQVGGLYTASGYELVDKGNTLLFRLTNSPIPASFSLPVKVFGVEIS